MNRNITIFASLLGLLLITALSGCYGSEHLERWELIDVETSGITLTAGSDDILRGDIAAGGASFTFTGVGKGAHYAFISSLTVNDEVVWRGTVTESDPVNTEKPLAAGEWGSVRYLTDKPPFKISFTVSPNNTDATRHINLTLGGVWYSKRDIELTQPTR